MKQIFLESTLQLMFEINPTVVQQIINTYKKKQIETEITYYISQ